MARSQKAQHFRGKVRDRVPRTRARGVPAGSGAGGGPPRADDPASVSIPPSHELPVCAICLRGGEEPRHFHRLAHGVSVWLCTAHGSWEYRCREGGARFAERLVRVWRAAGALTAKRVAALELHRRRLDQAGGQRDRPGSYSWRELREELEERFARGAVPADVHDEIRERYRDCPARMPSDRTIRRWYAQGRWLPLTAIRASTRGGRKPHPYVPWAFVLLPRVLKEEVLWLYPSFARQERGP